MGICIAKAHRSLEDNNIAGEIIIADNGSTDGSQSIASQMGARLIHVESKGYGTALMDGIAAARGKFIIMGDADDSYDFDGSVNLHWEPVRNAPAMTAQRFINVENEQLILYVVVILLGWLCR